MIPPDQMVITNVHVHVHTYNICVTVIYML